MLEPDRSTAPEIHRIGKLVMPDAERRVLENGIELVTYSGGDENVNRLTIAMAGGSAEQPCAGFASLMAASTIEGTTGLTAGQIAENLDYNGSWFTSGSSVHDTTRSFFSLNSQFANVIKTIAETVESPTFPEHETSVAIEKAARRAEIDNEKVSIHAAEALDKMLMGEKCQLTLRPSPETLRDITPSQIREWYSKRVTPRAIRLYLSGHIDNDTIRLVESAFCKISDRTNGGITTNDPVFTPCTPGKTVTIERPGALQSAIAAGIPTIGRSHRDYERLRLAVVFLGGYFGSRLMLNIREDKGFTYGIGASLTGYRDMGFIKIATECDNSYVDAVINEIHAELRRMHDPSTYTNAELDRCRSFMSTTLCSQLDSPFAVMDYHQNIDLIGTPYDYFARQQASLEDMTAESLAETARTYIDPDRLCLAIAGDTSSNPSPVK